MHQIYSVVGCRLCKCVVVYEDMYAYNRQGRRALHAEKQARPAPKWTIVWVWPAEPWQRLDVQVLKHTSTKQSAQWRGRLAAQGGGGSSHRTDPWQSVTAGLSARPRLSQLQRALTHLIHAGGKCCGCLKGRATRRAASGRCAAAGVWPGPNPGGGTKGTSVRALA